VRGGPLRRLTPSGGKFFAPAQEAGRQRWLIVRDGEPARLEVRVDIAYSRTPQGGLCYVRTSRTTVDVTPHSS